MKPHHIILIGALISLSPAIKAQDSTKAVIKVKPVAQKNEDDKAAEQKEAEKRAKQKEGQARAKAEDEAAMKAAYQLEVKQIQEEHARKEKKKEEKRKKKAEKRRKRAEKDQKEGDSKYSAPAPLGK